MSKPLIAIPGRMSPEATGHRTPVTSCGQNYIDAIHRAGGLPVLVPPTDDMSTISQTIARCDGMLMIGGGDVSKDRLMPDLISAYMNNKAPTLRYPDSVRPWQHVLDCLNGYLMVSDSLLSGEKHSMMNIGPDKESFVTVAKVAELVASQLSVDPSWNQSESSEPHEAGLLSLDASLAKKSLGWHDKLKFTDAIKWTTNWYQKVDTNENARDVTLEQIENFLSL